MDIKARGMIDRWLVEQKAKVNRTWQQATRRPKLLDSWAGETRIDRNGRHWFQLPDGRWTPAIGGGGPGYVEPLHITNADGTQVSNTTTETIVVPDANVPAEFMQALPPRTLQIWAFGVMSNVVTTPGTLIMRVRWGGVSGVVLVQSAAQGLDTTAHTNGLWAMLVHVTCRSQGATGTFLSGGVLWVFDLLSATAANLLPALLGSAGTPGASGSAPVTVDTTIQKALSVTAQFSVATSPTNLTCQQRIITALN